MNVTRGTLMQRRHAGGFTLVELIIAMAINAVLMAGMVSVMVIAGHSIPSADSEVETQRITDDVIGRIVAELREARTIITANTTEIEFTVADRSVPSDGSDETIRYVWSGVPGEPLTRQYNGGAVVTLIADVQALEFDFGLESTTGDLQLAPIIETAEGPLLLQDGTLLIGSDSRTDIGVDQRVAAGFEPVYPPTAVKWNITRVEFQPNHAGISDNQLKVRVRQAADSGWPGESETFKQIAESGFSDGAWFSVTFAEPATLDAGEVGFISIEHWSGDDLAASLATKSSVSNSPGTSYWFYDGASWVEDPTKDLKLNVYGTFMIPDPAWTAATDNVVISIGLSARAGADTQTESRARATTFNRPAMP